MAENYESCTFRKVFLVFFAPVPESREHEPLPVSDRGERLDNPEDVLYPPRENPQSLRWDQKSIPLLALKSRFTVAKTRFARPE